MFLPLCPLNVFWEGKLGDDENAQNRHLLPKVGSESDRPGLSECNFGRCLGAAPCPPPFLSPRALQHPHPGHVPSTPHCSGKDCLHPRGHFLNQAWTGSKHGSARAIEAELQGVCVCLSVCLGLKLTLAAHWFFVKLPSQLQERVKFCAAFSCCQAVRGQSLGWVNREHMGDVLSPPSPTTCPNPQPSDTGISLHPKPGAQTN